VGFVRPYSTGTGTDAVCDKSSGGKRTMVVHHRVPGRSVLQLMITLCPGCHAKVHRTGPFLLSCPRSWWSCCGSSIRRAMNKSRSTLVSQAQRQLRCRSFEIRSTLMVLMGCSGILNLLPRAKDRDGRGLAAVLDVLGCQEV
jgi:hypothetical protein